MSEAEVFWGVLLSVLWVALGLGGMAVEWVLERCER